MSNRSEHLRAGATIPLHPVTLRWALKRAALGFAILAVAMGAVAWLTYASIDPATDRADQAKAAKAPRVVRESTPVRL